MKRHVLSLLIALVGTVSLANLARADIRIDDIRGNAVTLKAPADRIAVDDGRTILAMSFLSDDPVGLVAAWPHDVDRMGREIYNVYRRKFPAIETLPRLASNAQDTNVEQILAVNPDVVFLSAFSHVSQAQIDQIKDAGIAVIFIDFQNDPLKDTDRSLEIIGKAIGRDEAAERIVSLRQNARKAIEAKLDEAKKSAPADGAAKPVVLVEPHASTQDPCCNSPGEAGVGTFLSLIGVDNVGHVIGKKPAGKLGLEYLITAKPTVYIATGGTYMKDRGGLLVGPDFDQAQTKASLSALVERTGFSALDFKPDQVHGLSQQLFNSPLDILALELFAKWSRPQLFSDLDPDKTLQEMNRMMAVPLEGRYWTR
ncbi:ABC transporter substrate-binding protein [Neorhizobium sp. NCHU2750]|uniref:ABC transporter substrate-binding protein n=1 Tax=Neorhizobium sp. NCHU2750 TaxID=1825976 RepID=UPI000E70AB77|nr:iron ABC transporter substrate-binding protein [Neorhizobium sp. NCHU2750]